MYSIKQTNYHYYVELTEFMDELHKEGWSVVQIIDTCASGDNKKMHQATILVKKVLKDVKELTEQEGAEILEFVYPGKTKLNNPKNYDYWFTGLSLKPTITKEGHQQITMGGRSIIGINFHNGQDNCILHFDNTKVVLWLYKNGYNILNLLDQNSDMSEAENDFDNMAFEIYHLSKGEKAFAEGYEQNFTLDYVKKTCRDMYEKYFLKEKLKE